MGGQGGQLPRNEHDFGEVDGIDALLLVFFELNAAVL